MVDKTINQPIESPASARIRPGAILALMSGAQFIITLDIAIVNVASPSIRADLGLAP